MFKNVPLVREHLSMEPLHLSLSLRYLQFHVKNYSSIDCYNYLPQVHHRDRVCDQLNDYTAPQCHHTKHENNRSWKKVKGAFGGCTVLSSTWTGPKYRSVGYHGKCHEHPALTGLSQTEGVTQKTAVRLTSVGSNQTQPAACQHSPTEPFSFSAWSSKAVVKLCWDDISRLRWVWYKINQGIS